jgi:hypothetical protein
LQCPHHGAKNSTSTTPFEFSTCTKGETRHTAQREPKMEAPIWWLRGRGSRARPSIWSCWGWAGGRGSRRSRVRQPGRRPLPLGGAPRRRRDAWRSREASGSGEGGGGIKRQWRLAIGFRRSAAN